LSDGRQHLENERRWGGDVLCHGTDVDDSP
jgi:hypothetical protein